MSISKLRRDPAVCNTTPVRYFALADRLDLLVTALGGLARLPRQVLDPTEEPSSPSGLLSEIGESERYSAARSLKPKATDAWSRLRALRGRQDLEICDLDSDEELVIYAHLRAPESVRDHGLAAPLGRGEAAVMAIAASRGWSAVIDDREGRHVLAAISPPTPIYTTRDILRHLVAAQELSRDEADGIYSEMLDWGYRGPPDLYQP